MEQIISNLLVSDSEVIKKASADLNEALKNPNAIPALMEITIASPNPQLRQYSAVLLKKQLGKLRSWQALSTDDRNVIKANMLSALTRESEKPVRTAIGQLVGVLIKHEDNSGGGAWVNEILKFIFEYCRSSNANESELGSSVFAVLTDTAPDQFISHIDAICEMFVAVLMVSDQANPNVVYNIITGMSHLVPFILGHNGAEHTYQKAIPIVVKTLEALAQIDSDKFVKAFEILENLADFTPKLLTSNTQLLIEFCLKTASNFQIDCSARVKAISYVGWLIRLKKKIVIKMKLVEPILHVIFNLMSAEQENEDDDEDEDYFLGNDLSKPTHSATQTMDLMALHIPPEKFIPPLLQLLEPALQSNSPYSKKAAYLCMAVIAEGCSEAICSKYLPTFLEIVKVGIIDQNVIVRNAAFFALGQFSEHLQPDITKFAPEILPILFQYLHQLCNELKLKTGDGNEPKHFDRMFYALETFCENLDSDIVPHLPILMERLFDALDPRNSVKVRELALSSVCAAANAAKTNMLPYFLQLTEGLKMYLQKSENEDVIALRPQAIDTLAALARTIGKENFMPLANDTMNFALALLEEADDPDLRRALYNLIAALAEVVNEKMEHVFPKIIEKIFDTVVNTEEIIPEYKENALLDGTNPVTREEGNDADDAEIDIEHSDNENDDQDDIAGYSVENSYLDEKEEAILTLKEFAQHTGSAFNPYLQMAFQNVYKMIDHVQEDIRKVSIDTLVAFVIFLYKQKNEEGTRNAIQILLPKLAHIVNNDEECSVVMCALEGVAELLKEMKCFVISDENSMELIFCCINDVMSGKIACQFDEQEGENDEDDPEESEYDEAVVETAGNILPLFGRALQPDQFAVFFERISPIIIQKIEKSKKNDYNGDSMRSFAYGALAECFQPLLHNTEKYFDILLPILLDGVSDKSEQVRQNSVYGTGEMVFYAKTKSFSSYPHILTALSHAVSKEKHQGVLDNICGAIARLIITNSNLVPLEQVLPVFMGQLPVKEDFEENNSIFKCFKQLYLDGKEILIQYLEQIIAFATDILYKKEYKDEETYNNVLGFIKEIKDKFPEKYSTVINSNPEAATFLNSLFL
ncbi:importin-4-like [Condylostylus longicornis]|uniref:importin-4-like n=1 Tax=Condylostylus longicornis TaxID=2530218 RepID=UPI00244E1D6E|nr:importin-4-like [Condylostylus longicornis]